MRLAIPTLIVAVILVLGWRVCSPGEGDQLRLTEEDLPSELSSGIETVTERAGEAADAAGDLAGRAGDAVSARGAAVADAARDSAAEATEAASSTARRALDNASELGSTALENAAKRASETTSAVRDTATRAGEALDAPSIDAPRLPAVSAQTQTADASPTPTAAGTRRLYVVKQGDWLMQIARDQYGDAGRAKDIATANGLRDSDTLKPGQELILP